MFLACLVAGNLRHELNLNMVASNIKSHQNNSANFAMCFSYLIDVISLNSSLSFGSITRYKCAHHPEIVKNEILWASIVNIFTVDHSHNQSNLLTSFVVTRSFNLFIHRIVNLSDGISIHLEYAKNSSGIGTCFSSNSFLSKSIGIQLNQVISSTSLTSSLVSQFL